jgi:hypothetical protein
MRLLTLLMLFSSAAAAAQTAISTPSTSQLIGFVTIEGRHPDLPCPGREERVGELHLTELLSPASRGPKLGRTLVLPLTCAAAPALAFSVSVPPGTWQISVSGDLVQSSPRRVVVGGARQLITIEARPGGPGASALALHDHHRDGAVAGTLGRP